MPQSGQVMAWTTAGQWVCCDPPAGQAFPVGSIFLSALSTNPSTLLGYGTWISIGAGRVLIGLNEGDPDFDTLGETGGSKTSNALLAHTHTVTDAGHNHTQNAHTHVQNSFAPRIINSGTAGTVGVQGASAASNANASNAATTATNQNATATNNSATTGVTVNSAGSGSSFSLMNPYLVVAMWQRTA